MKQNAVGRFSGLFLPYLAACLPITWTVTCRGLTRGEHGTYSSGVCSGFTPDSLLVGQRSYTNHTAKLQ